MELTALRWFSQAMEQGSFAAVARRNGVDPSSVSRAIAGLEGELGFQLFERTTRKLAPTEAGARYYENVRDLVEDLAAAAEAARDLFQQPSGTLRLTTSTFFGQTVLAPTLPELLQRHPALRLDLVLADHHVDLISERIDLAIRFGARPEGALEVERLRERRFVVAASPAYLARRGYPAAPADLVDHDCVCVATPAFRDRWRFRREGGEPFSIAVTARVQVSHGGTAIACALSGVGPAVLADWAAATGLASGALVDLFPDFEVTSTEFDTGCWLVHAPKSPEPTKLRVVKDYLREKLGAR
jgi:DNA-binding transcriptional LysR family regulator